MKIDMVDIIKEEKYNVDTCTKNQRRIFTLSDLLYKIADKNNVSITYFNSLERTGSCSARINDSCYIGISNNIKNATELNIHLAHELGHCLTGSFYNIYAPLDNRIKHELLADRWSYKMLVPLCNLQAAINNGIYQTWDLADYFCVTEEYIKKAVIYYQENDMIGYLRGVT